MNFRSGVTQNQDSLLCVANICSKFSITSFKLKIGDDNVVGSGVENFEFLTKQNLKSFNIKIGYVITV